MFFDEDKKDSDKESIFEEITSTDDYYKWDYDVDSDSNEKEHKSDSDDEYFDIEKTEKRISFMSGMLTGIAAALLITLIFAGIFFYRMGKRIAHSDNSSTAATDDLMNEKTELIKNIIDFYNLEEVDDQALADGMYKGMISTLDDPYAAYYPAAEYSAIVEDNNGSYVGIGSYISQSIETGEIVIAGPFEGSPAMKAGLLTGDIVLAVDGRSCEDEELSAVTARIKGEEGTVVVLTIKRDEEVFDVEVTRGYVEVTTVSGFMVDEEIGYIAILSFDMVTSDQFENLLNDFKSQGMKKLIIDLRDNPGGNLAIVTDILDKILPEGITVYTEDKYGEGEKFTSDEEHQLNMDMVVLINENSASASEIFAGAIQDYHWGTLIGTTTYGKGIVQRVFPLADGSAVKITVSKYYTPSGRDIHGKGIEPDIVVEIPEEALEDREITEEEDTQYQEAIRVLKEK